ncbi:MAG TPA: cytochrome c [Terriglobales bacterium]|nr:cytochrome c [Terriglobales bacterium]
MLFGCGFRLDMHIQPKVKPLRQSDFFEDGRASRPLIPGTVARGEAREDTYYYTGMVAANKPGDEMPFPVTKEVLERGQERFNIYCTPCHSRLGDGNGMVVQRGYRRPPSFHDPKLLNAPLGHFFDVMTNGFGAMPDYAAQVTPTDRWKIAAYIRALQLSQRATQAEVPPGTQIPSLTAPVSGTPGTGATLPPGEQGMERKTP